MRISLQCALRSMFQRTPFFDLSGTAATVSQYIQEMTTTQQQLTYASVWFRIV